MKWVYFTEQALILVLVLLLSSPTSIRLSESSDRLSSGESISGNQTIVSAGGTYTLGFFSPANSSSNLYLGIWYNNINNRRIVWVANRETPVRNSPAVLQISGNSNLVILDSKNGNFFWSSNISSSTPIPTTNGTSAVLLDSGNLVLQHDGTTLWQSFDFPTDTLLPGMVLWSNLNTRTSKTISSWKDTYDPSPGNFSFGIDAMLPYQLLTKRGSKPFWRSQVWTGTSFSALLAVKTTSIFYMTYTTDGVWNNVTLSVSDSSILSFIRLNHTGFLEQVEWEADSATWALLATLPQLICDSYELCGPFGYCDATDSPSTCKCLEGYEPRSQDDWEKSIFHGGCVRKMGLGCDDRKDEFLTYNQMKLPDHAVVVLDNVNMTECQKFCVTNCSCTAYTYSDSTNSSRLSACYVWFDEIIDLDKVPAGGKDLFVRIAVSDSGKKKGSRLAVILIVISVVIAVLCVAFVYLICKRNNRRPAKRSELLDWGGNLRYNRQVDTSSSSGFGEEIKQDLPLFSLDSLMAATDNFSELNRIGRGGFGIVYMAKFQDGQEFAIKRLSKGSVQGLEEFKNEVTLIAKLQHRNLVRLMGYCVEREERMLIYEYMPNNSLDSFLLNREKSVLLDWEKRFSIIKGIARGLLYLHQDSRLRIIHRDLKAGNILLDKDMNPKISDFGMARIFGGDQNQANTNRVVGTYGYMSPEYAMKGHFSVKSDVYSYGVLILEILSGIKNTGLHLPQGFPNLLSYAWKLWDEKRTPEMIDPSIVLDSSSSENVARCILVGLLCVQDKPSDRPTMSSVVFMLENGYTSPEYVPKRPSFTTEVEQDVVGVDDQQLFPTPTSFSVNNVTITVMHAR